MAEKSIIFWPQKAVRLEEMRIFAKKRDRTRSAKEKRAHFEETRAQTAQTSAFWTKMRPKWSLKRDIDTFLGKTCSNEDPKRDDGHKIGKNVAKCMLIVANSDI